MTERRSHLILISVIGLALVTALLFAIPGTPLYKAPRLGLDLQGGLEVVLKAQPEQNRKLQAADVDRSLEIIRERVDKLGVAEPTITKQGEDQISVELPGIENVEAAQEIIGKTAELQLYDLEPALTGPSISARGDPIPSESLYDLLADTRTTSLRQRNGVGGPFYLFDRESKKLLAGPAPTQKALLEKRDGKVPEGARVLGVPKETTIIQCGIGEVVCPGVNVENPSENFYYLFKFTPDAGGHRRAVPADDGRGPAAVGHARRRRPDAGADRAHAVHRRRRRQVRGHHARGVVARPPARRAPALRDRAGRRDQVLAADQPRRQLAVERHRRRLGADHRHRRPRRGQEHRPRPPDRRAAGRVPHADVDRDLGHARRGLPARGPARRDRRA